MEQTLQPVVTRPLVNPYGAMADQFRQSWDAEQSAARAVEAQAQEPVQEPPQPAAQAAPEPAQYEQAVAPQPEGIDPAYYNALMDEHRKLSGAYQELLSRQAEYDELQRQAAARASLNAEAFKDLATVDPDDAVAISGQVMNATNAELAAIRKEMADLRASAMERDKQTAEAFAQQRMFDVNRRIMAAHPDYDTFRKSKQYADYMGQRDGLSSQTRDQRCAAEYMAGNADYVIDMLNRAKGASNVPADVAVVPPVQVAQGVATPPASRPTMTLGDLNALYQIHAITPEQYRSELAKIKNSQGG